MKTYKEMADSALKRIDELEVKKKKRQKIIKQTAISLGSICVVLLVAIGIFKSENRGTVIVGEETKNTVKITSETATEVILTENKTDKKTTQSQKNDKTQPTSEKGTTKTTEKNTTENQKVDKTQSASEKGTVKSTEKAQVTPSFKGTTLNSQGTLNVIYAEDTLKGGANFAKPIKKGSVVITDDLKSAIEKHGTKSTYAIMVSFKYSLPDNYSDEIMIDGMSATELKNKADTLLSEGKNSAAKRLYVKIKDAEREYLLNYTEKFKDTFAKNGMEIYNEKNGTAAIDNMIFYSYATVDQIENFTCKSTEAFYFDHATRFK